MGTLMLRNRMMGSSSHLDTFLTLLQAEIVRHIRVTETAHPTLGEGGNAKYVYDTYVAPYIGEADSILVTVSNNIAAGNRAKSMLVTDKFLPEPRQGYVYAIRGVNSAIYEARQIDDQIDFFMSAGSVVDVWVFNLNLIV